MNQLEFIASQVASALLSRQTTGPFTEIPKQLYQGQLPNSVGTLYTAPAAYGVESGTGLDPKAKVKELLIANTDTADHTVTLHVVASGGSASAATQILPGVNVTAGSLLQISMDTIIEASGTIQGLADAASKVTVTISGVELV